MRERLSFVHVEDKDDSVTAAIIGRGEGAETLLRKRESGGG